MREFSRISSTQNEEMSSGNDEMEAELGAEAMQEANMIFAMHCENFATIAKISQSQRKFRYAHFFAKLAKFRYHSESYCA